MSEGYIYVMTNPCLHDMVKIDYASDVEARRKQLTLLPYLLSTKYMQHTRHQGSWRIRSCTSL